jgi:hypothetical protein
MGGKIPFFVMRIQSKTPQEILPFICDILRRKSMSSRSVSPLIAEEQRRSIVVIAACGFSSEPGLGGKDCREEFSFSFE